MDFENNCCPIVDVDGHIETGKQFDLEIVIPEDNRGVLFGTVKDCHKEPVKNAVVKLIEIDFECGKEERKPVSHTFTDEDGEFVFGPLCTDRKYEVQIWATNVKNIKVCSKCHHEGKCLKGINQKNCDCFIGKDKENHMYDKNCRPDKSDK